MTWAQDKFSVEDGDTRTLVIFRFPFLIKYVAFSEVDITWNGNTYKSATGHYEDLQVSSNDNNGDFVIKIGSHHPVVLSYQRNGITVTDLTIEVFDYECNSRGGVRTFYGKAMSCAIDKNLASFRIVSELSDAAQRQFPVRTAGRQCPYILYDLNCKVPEAGNYVLTTVSTVSRSDYTVGTMSGHATDWATFGYVLIVTTQEKFYIRRQAGNVVTLQFPVPNLTVGMAVRVYAGCARNVDACMNKFNNMVNMGGQPYMPLQPITNEAGNGFGVIVQA